MDVWVEHELKGCDFPDQRLKSRLGKVLGVLGERIGETLPAACQDWAATKAAYRFFSNPRVNESIILAGHFAATRSRMAATKGLILILHDTTEFSFQRQTRCDRQDARHRGSQRSSRLVHGLRVADAFQSGAHAARQAVRAGGREVLDSQEIQRGQ